MGKVCYELVANNASKRVVCVLSADADWFHVLRKAACDKLRANKSKVKMYWAATTNEILPDIILDDVRNSNNHAKKVMVIVCGKGEILSQQWTDALEKANRKQIQIEGVSANDMTTERASQSATIRYTHGTSEVEEEALLQVEIAAKLPFMRLCVGMPDLHPGRGSAVGCAYCSSGVIYPHLVGNDIGCGMTLFETGLRSKDNNSKRSTRWAEELELESNLDADYVGKWLSDRNVEPTEFDRTSLGTIGGGNHFAELQEVESIVDQEACKEMGVRESQLYLLVHSGSRGFGKRTFERHVDNVSYEKNGLKVGTDEFEEYMKGHDHCCAWAKANRELIARRFLDCLGEDLQSREVLNVSHNAVVSREFVCEGDGGGSTEELYLHRKGAAPSDTGFAVIPGSRGAFSFIVRPSSSRSELQQGAYSLPHGAGRKWRRDKARKKGQADGNAKSYLKTPLGSCVVCEDKDLLYEEAPQAYKEIEGIIQDVTASNLASVVAVMRPVLTYKMRAMVY